MTKINKKCKFEDNCWVNSKYCKQCKSFNFCKCKQKLKEDEEVEE